MACNPNCRDTPLLYLPRNKVFLFLRIMIVGDEAVHQALQITQNPKLFSDLQPWQFL